jgi:hypothetical protein
VTLPAFCQKNTFIDRANIEPAEAKYFGFYLINYTKMEDEKRPFGVPRYLPGTQKASKNPSLLPVYTNLGFKADRVPIIRELLPQPRGYKWLDKYLDSLDPDKDYEQIIRTEFNYTFSNFFFTIPYTTAFINVQQNPIGADLVTTTGKAFGINHGHARQTDGNGFFFTWMLEGVSSEVSAKSLERLNNLHMSIAKRMPPGVFEDKDDYIYALIEVTTFGQILRDVLGLPPMSQHRRKAQCNWARAVYSHIRLPQGMADVNDFPDTFEGMLKFREEWNNRPHVQNANMELTGNTLINHFCYRWFPRPLWFIGRELIIMFLPDSSVRLFKLGPRKPVLDAILKFLLRSFIRLGAILPDPRTGLIDLIEETERKKSGNYVSQQKSSRFLIYTLLFMIALSAVGLYSFPGLHGLAESVRS